MSQPEELNCSETPPEGTDAKLSSCCSANVVGDADLRPLREKRPIDGSVENALTFHTSIPILRPTSASENVGRRINPHNRITAKPRPKVHRCETV